MRSRARSHLRDFDPALRKVRRTRGMALRLAEALDLSGPAIYGWRRVPAEHVHTVEEMTGVPRHKIRPDLYPKARERI